MTTDISAPAKDNTVRVREWRLFLFIVVFLFPLLSVMLVGAYGFSIWMYQLVMGPPGPIV